MFQPCASILHCLVHLHMPCYCLDSVAGARQRAPPCISLHQRQPHGGWLPSKQLTRTHLPQLRLLLAAQRLRPSCASAGSPCDAPWPAAAPAEQTKLLMGVAASARKLLMATNQLLGSC